VSRPIYERAADSVRGLTEGVRRDRSVRTHLLFAALAVTALAWLQPALAWSLAVAVLLVLGLVVELLNGALEVLLDRLHPQEDAEIGAAKDLASAAAMVINCAAVAATAGAIFSEL
jgi:diacylglycerol kinase (ATP)